MQQSTTTSRVAVVDTGTPALNALLGVGGYARGRLSQLEGASFTANDFLALSAAAALQERGGVAAFIDAGHRFEPEQARTHGVRMGELLISQPDDAFQTLDVARALVKSGAVDLVVVDSMGERPETLEDVELRRLSSAFRHLCEATQRSHTALLFVGRPTKRMGNGISNALRYYAHVRCHVARVGRFVTVRTVKNKLGPIFEEATLEMPR
jgi:recombination protein RecA